MPKEKDPKTNVMRILDREKIPYHVYLYDHQDGKIDGLSVALKLSQNQDQVFKTLVTRGNSKNFFVFVIPVAKELALKAAAKSVGEKSLQLIHVDEILATTGYIRGGCSPIGMKKNYPTVLDESALSQPSIIYSAGKIGAQVETSPQDLLRLIGAKTAAIT